MKTIDDADALLKQIHRSLYDITTGMRIAHWQTIREQLKPMRAVAKALENIHREIEAQNRN